MLLHRGSTGHGRKGHSMEKIRFTISSRNEDHTPVQCVKWLPEGKPTGIVVLVHGMAEYIERYEELAAFLCDRGYLVTGEDLLGHGQTAESKDDLGYFCEQDPATVLVRDVHRLKKTVQSEYPGIPIFILGHSMGSFITRNYLCRYGTGVRGAVIVGTGMQSKGLLCLSKAMVAVQEVLFGSRHKASLINGLAFGGYNKQIPDAKTPMDWLSARRDNVDNYNNDPLCGFTFTVNGFKTLFELIWRLYNRDLLEKMPKMLPVLFIAGNADPVGEYGKAVERVYNSFRDELGMQDVTMHLMDGDRHEVLNEDDREKTFAIIADWMESKK